MRLLAVVDTSENRITQVDANLQPLSFGRRKSSACACEPTSANFRDAVVLSSCCTGTALRPAVSGSLPAVVDMPASLYLWTFETRRALLGVIGILVVLKYCMRASYRGPQVVSNKKCQ